jgi:acetyl esterase/lipase
MHALARAPSRLVFRAAALLAATIAGADAAPPAMKEYVDLAYAPGDNPRQTLDLVVPESADGKPMPLIVWIHGGAWKGGSKEPNRARKFARYGFAAASLNYRLSQEAKFPAQLEDCALALAFLRKNAAKYGIDPNRIGLLGASSGGHLVELLALRHPDGIKAVCAWFAPSDLTRMGSDSDEHSAVDHDASNSPESRLLGGRISERGELARQASPINFISKKAPPFLLLHGESDAVVPLKQSERMDTELRKAGVESTLLVVPGAGHGNQVLTPETRKAMIDFFRRHLQGPR